MAGPQRVRRVLDVCVPASRGRRWRCTSHFLCAKMGVAGVVGSQRVQSAVYQERVVAVFEAMEEDARARRDCFASGGRVERELFGAAHLAGLGFRVPEANVHQIHVQNDVSITDHGAF